HFPNIRIVVNLVSPKHRQDCLNIGTGGALVPGEIKALLRPGLCISVNCVREILQTNARSFLKTTCRLKVHPNSTPDNQVYLINADITAASISAPSFDIITAVHAFSNILEADKSRGLPYATRLGNAASLRVTAIEPISKNNDFGIACPGQDSGPSALLSFRDLNNISASNINKVLTTSGVNGYCDISSAIFALFQKANPTINNADRRRRLVKYIRLRYRALEALNSSGQGQLYVGKRFVGIAVKFKKKDE
ncbi:hypothetical protein K504DRAFT_467072, partial [Pleomassaria siparia CBS 279.74]